MFIDEVATAIREVAAAEVLPRFQALAEGDVAEKSPGDYVTIADRECERVLSQRLRALQDAPVVGEEATAEDASLLELVAGADAAWVIDPIDGTSNFVGGKPDFVVMVALIESGETTHAWVWDPNRDSMLTARRGEGTHRNGARLPTPSRGPGLSGTIKSKYVPEPGRTQLREAASQLGTPVPAQGSAGVEYASLVDGTIDYLFYWRTLPWDHAPCALLATEAGLTVARPDGTPYRPGDTGTGLLAAVPQAWDQLAANIHPTLPKAE